MVPRTVSGDVAGVLPARQPAGHGRLLAGRSVATRRDSTLPLVVAARPGGDLPGAGDQPTHGGALVPPLRPRRASRGRGGAAASGREQLTQAPGERREARVCWSGTGREQERVLEAQAGKDDAE